MGKFNLLDEPWIKVLSIDSGDTHQVSLLQLFKNAHNYQSLAGDSKTQDFAVFRLLLAILQTVFSRFDFEGDVYEYLQLNEHWQPVKPIEYEDDQEAYEDALLETWERVWKEGSFPSIIEDYLEKWRERFYLYDEEYPFFQVTKDEISQDKINKTKASQISGKNINRLISESENKVALFAPKSDGYKEQLTSSEIARWLIVFQGYTGLSDKVIFGKEKYKASKGWLFDIGAIMLEGNSLFQSLWLNCALVHPVENQGYTGIQIPCWENSPSENIKKLLLSPVVTNLAELYTNWSRAIYIDPTHSDENPFSLGIVKLPEIEHTNQYLELMSLWRYNTSGDNKGLFTPRKHHLNQAVWRSFGLITVSYDAIDQNDKGLPQRKPGIIDWLNMICSNLDDFPMALKAVSMQDDGNATSWLPTNEVYDELNIRESILTDIDVDGWIPRINDAIEETKIAIEKTFRAFVLDIKKIRNIATDAFVTQEVEDLYFRVDQPFRTWLCSIRSDDSKDDKIFQWRKELRIIILGKADRILQEAGPRDYRGIIDGGNMKNIATAYDSFLFYLRKQLPDKEVRDGN